MQNQREGLEEVPGGDTAARRVRGQSMDRTIERIRIEIPGVEVVGDFPIKRFLETIYNAAAKQYGVKLNATIMPFAEDRRAAEREREGA